ncbi:MAG: acyltransferase [Actinobacteria bacterium]|nr:acyltransferase [Actinomycetota bacterium]
MQTSSATKITQIQGLRALAALLVTLFHAKWVSGGFIGVDIFYVISGFLITGLLLREIERTGTVNFKDFYARRFKRLLPTSFFVLAITAFISWLLIPGTMRSSLGRDVIAASLYISNYLFAWWQADYQNLDATPSPVIHYWSLAVEEQFYLVWPMLILVSFLFAKYLKKKVVLTYLIAFITLSSFIFSIYLTETSPIWAFYSLPTRAWELGLGALLVLIPPIKTKKIVGLFGFGLLIISAFLFNESTAFPGKNAALPVLGTVLLIATINSWPPFLNDVANSRLFQWLGEISYPLYLWHWPLLVLPSTYLARPLEIYERLLAIFATILLADLTHRYIEEPQIKARPQVYDDGCHANYSQTQSAKCEYANLDSEKVMVLYGDSHAAQWFPALLEIANRSGYKLISLTKSACPAVDTKRNDQGGFKMAKCAKWRENTTKRIREIQPDVLVMSSFQYFAQPKQFTDRQAWWNEGQQKLMRAVKTASPHLIYITDTPHPTRDIPACLTNNPISKCNTSERSKDLSIPGFDVIDPNPWLCSNVCPAVKDGVVAYRDASHISVDMSIALIPRLMQALRDQGVNL